MIYLHHSTSNRFEGFEYAQYLIPAGVTLFAFDMSGSGNSDGEYISLGYYEKDDVADVVKYLRNTGTVGRIAIWGRSMGAVTAILYTQHDPSIAGLVLDSPITSARKLGEEMYEKYSSFPKIFMGFAIKLIKSSILSRAKFDLEDISPIDIVQALQHPALFVAASNDSYVSPHHGKELYDKYGGSKESMIVVGDHLDSRGSTCTNKEITFLIQCLKSTQVVQASADPANMHKKVNHKKVPKKYLCPISKKIMTNPMVTLCNHNFEKDVIEMRIAKCKECPFCGFALSLDGLKPNLQLKSEIDKYAEERAMTNSMNEMIGGDLAKKEEWFDYVCHLSKEEQVKLVLQLSMKIKCKTDLM